MKYKINNVTWFINLEEEKKKSGTKIKYNTGIVQKNK